MDIFRGAAASACFLGIIFSALGTIVSGEKFSRQINILFSLIMVLTVAAPFADFDLDLDIPEISDTFEQNSSEIYSRNLTETVQSELCGEIGSLLEENGIIPVKISADVNNFADGSISISKVSVSLSDSKDIKRAERLLGEALGDDIRTEVYAEGSEENR